ncbi:CHAP domain-containing protein [Nonomuraea dietziae]|uniref:CHAP domain-containing protein n=1 Tax=Nonomuraea dietziae TaxID=65515 RepID=UPI0033F8A0B9
MTPETQKLLELLESQLGYSEGNGAYTKFGDWYGKTVEFDADYSGAPWCDMFLSWAAHKLGYEEWVGQFAYTVAHAKWFKKNDAWGHKPKPGALVFYDWSGSNDIDNIDHVGIVTKVVGDTIFTIEGNIDGGVAKRKERDQSKVAGYGYPEKIKERLEAAQLKEAEVEGSLPPDTEQGQADRLQLPAPAETTVTSLIPSRLPSAEPSSPTMAAGAEDAATPKAATAPKSTSPSPSASSPRSPATTATDKPVAKKAKHAKPATADTEAATREPVTAFKDASAATPVPSLGSPALIGPVLLAALGVLAVARTRQLRVRLSPAAAAATASTSRSASAPALGSASASRPAVGSASASARPSRQPGRRRASGSRRGRPLSARPAEHPATSPLTATALTISAPAALPAPVTTTDPTLAFAATAAEHAPASTTSEASAAASTAAASTTASEAVGALDASLASEAVSSLEMPTTSEAVSSLGTPTTAEATAFDVMAATGTRAESGSGHAPVRASALASDPAAALAAGLETSSAILAQLEAFSSAPFDAFSSAPFEAFAEATAPSGDGYRGRRRRREHLAEESAALASDAPIRGRRHRSQAPAFTRGQDTRAHRATSTGSPARLTRPARPTRPTRSARPEQPARGTTTAPHADVLVHSAVTGPHADTLVHSGAPRSGALPHGAAAGRQRDSLVTGPPADQLVHSGAADGFGRGATDTFSAAPLRGRRHRDSSERRDATPAPHPFPSPETATTPPARIPSPPSGQVPAAFTPPAQATQVQSGRQQEPVLVGASGGPGGRSGGGRGGRHRA